MRNLTKKEAIRVITESAQKYEAYLCNRQFLIAYAQGTAVGFSLLGFRAYHFKHLTGVKSSDGAPRFYSKALNHRLSESDFSFDQGGNAQRKLAVLPAMHLLLYGNATHGYFNRSGICIEADYFVGRTKYNTALAFRFGEDYDVPVSLYCEDIRKLTTETHRILAIWQRPFGSEKFENTYTNENTEAEQLLLQWASSQELKSSL